MADGVRIMATDERLRGAILEIPHPTRMLGTGGHKLYRVRLDGEGAAIVSTVVWGRIKEIMAIDQAAPRFIEVGTVAAPPTQHLSGRVERRPVVTHLTGHGIVQHGVHQVPAVHLQ